MTYVKLYATGQPFRNQQIPGGPCENLRCFERLESKSVETEVIGSHTGDSPAARVLNATVSTEISVADLLEAVKENCPEFTEINVLSPHPMTGVVLTRKNEGNQFCRS